MNFSSNQIGLTQATVYDISAADLAGANSGQRPDLLAKTQAIYRTPDQKLYAANAARSQLVAASTPVTAETNPLTGGIGSFKVGDKSISIWAKPTPNSVLAHWDNGGALAATPAASDFTYHTTMTVEYAATRFRFALMNANASTCVVGPAKIAVSNALGADVTFGATTGQSRFTPSTGTWVAVTWNAGSSTVTLPARISATQPSITYSDWIDISTVPRIDGGTLPVVMIRYLIPSSGSTNAYNSYGILEQHYGQNIASRANMGSAATAFTNGRLHQSIRFTGDGVTTPATFAPTTDFGYCMMPGIEYVSKKPGFTLLFNGDSITSGAVNATLGNYTNGWVRQMMNTLRNTLPKVPLEYVNLAIPSTQTNTFLTRFTTYIAAGGNFDMAFNSAFSFNDGTPTQATTDTGLNRLGQAITACKAANKPFGIIGPAPNTALGLTAPQDAFRLAVRSDVIDATFSHTACIDPNVVGDGATPERFVPEYTTEGSHPNELGQSVIAAAAVPVVLPLLA